MGALADVRSIPGGNVVANAWSGGLDADRVFGVPAFVGSEFKQRDCIEPGVMLEVGESPRWSPFVVMFGFVEPFVPFSSVLGGYGQVQMRITGTVVL